MDGLREGEGKLSGKYTQQRDTQRGMSTEQLGQIHILPRAFMFGCRKSATNSELVRDDPGYTIMSNRRTYHRAS